MMINLINLRIVHPDLQLLQIKWNKRGLLFVDD